MTEFVFEEVEPNAGAEHAIGDGATVGREGCDVLLDDPEVSRRHAAFRVVADEIAVEDLGSSNGTFVNDRRVASPTPLAPGDTVRVGTTTWRLAGTPAAETVIRSDAPATPVREPEPPPAAESAASQPPAPALPVSEPGAPAQASGARGDVPSPPDPAASAVRPAIVPEVATPPSFQVDGRPARRASAARSNVATGVSFAIILATAIALVIYFGARDEDGDEPAGQSAKPVPARVAAT